MNKVSPWILAALAGFALCATTASAEDPKGSKGQAIFLKYRCKSCHSIKALGIEKKTEAAGEEAGQTATLKRKPPDLSGIGTQHDAAWFAKWLQKKETVEGRKHIKMFRGSEAELKELTGWLASLKMDETGKPKTR